MTETRSPRQPSQSPAEVAYMRLVMRMPDRMNWTHLRTLREWAWQLGVEPWTEW